MSGVRAQVGATRRRRFRDVVGVTIMAALLALGVMGELSGARTPDPDLYPTYSFDALAHPDSFSCDGLALAAARPTGGAHTVIERVHLDVARAEFTARGCELAGRP